MTTLAALDDTNRTAMAAIQPRLYFCNDVDDMQVWDGSWSALSDAGIDAPGSIDNTTTTQPGNVTEGTHLLAYYYRDSTSPGGESEGYGYRSSLSPLRTEVIASGGWKVSLSITDDGGGGDIERSTDPKVDTIVLVATLAGGTEFFIVDEVANSGVSTIEYNISDSDLSQKIPLSLTGGTENHDKPPLFGQVALARSVAFGGVTFDATVTCTFLNGSTTITAAVGTFHEGWVGRLLTRTGDSVSYRIASFTSSDNINLAEVYAGSSGSDTAVISPTRPNTVYWSKQYYPESWDASSRAINSMTDVDDRLVCMAEYMGDPWMFGYRTAQRLLFTIDGSGNVTNYEVVTMSGSCGAWNRFCVVKPEPDALYCWGPNGVWILSGGRPTIISRPIDDDWRDLINYDETEAISGWYDPEEHEIGWMFCPSGSSVPSLAIVYDINGRRWRIDKYRGGIYSATLLRRSTGRIQCAMSDSDRAMTFIRGGTTDGVPAASSEQGRYTVGSGSTTTVTNVTESLPTGVAGAGLDNLYAYSPDLDETVVVSDNGASSITHAAFSQALSIGSYIYVGSIPVEVEFSWWQGRDQSVEKVPERIRIYAVPSSATTQLKVYQYRDFNSTPVNMSSLSRTLPKGVTRSSDGTHWIVDMSVSDGYIEVPVGAVAAKVLKAKLVSDDPSGEFTILNVDWKTGDVAPGGDGE